MLGADGRQVNQSDGVGGGSGGRLAKNPHYAHRPYFRDLLTAPSRRNFWRNPMESTTGQKGLRRESRKSLAVNAGFLLFGWSASIRFETPPLFLALFFMRERLRAKKPKPLHGLQGTRGSSVRLRGELLLLESGGLCVRL
jgi:hypothetical protein